MEIIAHRGLWTTAEQKNTMPALLNALKEGFGIETDIRDYERKLVISHNVAEESSPLAEELFRAYGDNYFRGMLALNIKADGLQTLLITLLKQYKVTNYFLFDMSIPEAVVNVDRGLTFYTRQSDVEHECVLYEKATGVWMDSFYNDAWMTLDGIRDHLHSGKSTCLVSPELHGRSPHAFWQMLKESGIAGSDQVALCTDKPFEAREYFYGE